MELESSVSSDMADSNMRMLDTARETSYSSVLVWTE